MGCLFIPIDREFIAGIKIEKESKLLLPFLSFIGDYIGSLRHLPPTEYLKPIHFPLHFLE